MSDRLDDRKVRSGRLSSDDLAGPLVLDENDRITIDTEGALEVTADDRLRLRVGDGLEQSNASPTTLKVKTGDGLSVSGGSLRVNTSTSVRLKDGLLVARPSAKEVSDSGEDGDLQSAIDRIRLNKEDADDHDADIEALQTIISGIEDSIDSILNTIEDITPIKGSTTLVAGTKTISLGVVQSGTKVLMSARTFGGTPGFLSVVVTAGVGFVITSSSVLDTSVVDYVVIL